MTIETELFLYEIEQVARLASGVTHQAFHDARNDAAPDGRLLLTEAAAQDIEAAVTAVSRVVEGARERLART